MITCRLLIVISVLVASSQFQMSATVLKMAEPTVYDVVSPASPPSIHQVASSNNMSLEEMNIAITKNYSILAEKLRATIDCPRKSTGKVVIFDANWLHLATWASRLAGEFISDHDHRFLQWAVVNWLGVQSDSVLSRVLGFVAQRRAEGVELGVSKPEAIVFSIKKLLSDGNLLVAQEVQAVTNEFIDYFSIRCAEIADGSEDINAIEREFFVRNFRRYEPMLNFSQSVDSGISEIVANLPGFDAGSRYEFDQDLILAEAFRLYFRVMVDLQMQESRRSQLIFTANVLVGLHEQHVLQTFVRGALSGFDIINPRIKSLFGATVMKLGVPFESVGCKKSVANRLTYLKFNRDVPLDPSDALGNLGEQELRYVFDRLDMFESFGRRAPDWTEFKGRISYIAAVYAGLHDNQFLTSSPYVGWCGEDSIGELKN